jgi:hypothetical protein
VDVHVEGVSEALHEGDGPALASGDAPLHPRPTPERAEDRAHEDAQDGAREWGVVGEAVAQREGQREHPLPHRDLGQDPVHQVRGRVGHAPPAARRAEAAALAGERDDPVESALVAVHADEALGEDAAAEESPELALDEAGHRALAGLRAGEEGLEFRLDHAVQDALLRPAAGVAVLFATLAGAMPVGSRKSVEAHPRERLPAPYPFPGA